MPISTTLQRRSWRLSIIRALLTFTICFGIGFSSPKVCMAQENFPNGVAAGDIGQWDETDLENDTYSAVLWARAAWAPEGQETSVLFEWGLDPCFSDAETGTSEPISDAMEPAKLEIRGLAESTEYHYRACRGACPAACPAPDNVPPLQAQGHFRTPPFFTEGTAEETPRVLRFGTSSCAEVAFRPYASIQNVPDRDLDFFVHLGDSIYADRNECGTGAPGAITVDDFRCFHEKTLGKKGDGIANVWEDVRASTALYATFDDHEVRNDIAGHATPKEKSPPCFYKEGGEIKKTYNPDACSKAEIKGGGHVNELRIFDDALQAFVEFNPIRGEIYEDDRPRTEGSRKIYRYRTFGQDAALFVLDARSFRDEQLTPTFSTIRGWLGALSGRAVRGLKPLFGGIFEDDDPSPTPVDYANKFYKKIHQDRQMLGRPQLSDLKEDLKHAQDGGILWKFVAIPEPIQHLGPVFAPERFEGYAEERDELLEFIQETPILNVVFISGDIHGTVVNNLVYREENLSANGNRKQRRRKTDQRFTRTWGISTGPLGHGALGQFDVVKGLKGKPLTQRIKELEYYESLERDDAATVGARMRDRDRYVEKRLNRILAKSDYPQVGLCGEGWGRDEGGPAELLVGSYLVVNTFGWTEFEIDADSKDLLVTTWGIEPYGTGDVPGNSSEEADFLMNHNPEIVSQFRVSRAAPESTVSSLNDACVAFSCSENSDCDQGDVCNRGRCTRRGTLPEGARCDTDLVCAEQDGAEYVCIRNPPLHQLRVCTRAYALNDGKRCANGKACESGICNDLGRCTSCGDGVCNSGEVCGNRDKLVVRLNECNSDCGKCERDEHCRLNNDCKGDLRCRIRPGAGRVCRDPVF